MSTASSYSFSGKFDKPVDPLAFWILSFVFTVFIIIGFSGNVLILWAVLGRYAQFAYDSMTLICVAQKHVL